MRSSGTPVALIWVERRDVNGVDAMVWWLVRCDKVSTSYEVGEWIEVYCKPLGGSLALPSDRRSHGGRLVVSPFHSVLLLSR